MVTVSPANWMDLPGWSLDDFSPRRTREREQQGGQGELEERGELDEQGQLGEQGEPKERQKEPEERREERGEPGVQDGLEKREEQGGPQERITARHFLVYFFIKIKIIKKSKNR